MILDLVGNFLRHAANTVTTSSLIKTWNSKIKAPHGGALGIHCREIYYTPTAAAHEHLVGVIPGGACIYAVTARVIKDITVQTDRTGLSILLGAESGSGGAVMATLAATSLVLRSGVVGSNVTAAGDASSQTYADGDITIEATGGNTGNMVAGGLLLIQIWYHFATAPTS